MEFDREDKLHALADTEIHRLLIKISDQKVALSFSRDKREIFIWKIFPFVVEFYVMK